MDSFKALYETAQSSGNLYNGHMVIEVGMNQTLDFVSSGSPIFDGKVMFIVRDGGKLTSNEGSFLKGTEKSSTLIYMDKGDAKLLDFGVNGLYRGLIYIHDENTANHSFKWGPNGRLEGAFHNFSNGTVNWNCNIENKVVPIKFDKGAINAFAPLIDGTDSNKTADFMDPTKTRIEAKAFGYYFH
jgi:hypothetical protein